MTDKIDFRYNYVEQKDFENQQTHSIFEFGVKPTEKFRFASFIDLNFNKTEDNVGLATSFFPKSTHEIKAFFNFIQFDRNKRNSEDDKFEKKPYAVGFIGRYLNSALKYFEYGFLYETPAQWNFPSENLSYRYRRWMGTVRFVKPLNSNETLAIFYQADRRSDDKTAISTNVTTDAFTLKRHQLLTNYKNKKFESFDLESGAYFVKRDAEYISNDWNYFDFVPFATMHFNRNDSSAGFWSAGYDIDFHRSSKDGIKKRRAEQRANLYWTARFKKDAYLKFAFTLDTDDISWEGGNGQFVMEF